MRRALFHVVWIAALLPTSVGAQEPGSGGGEPWWLRVIVFVVSLPYTLYMVFVDGQRLHLLPAPLLGGALCLWSFLEWRRQGFWTPRIIHLMAVLGFATIVMINVAWVRAGGEMWTQRYVVIALFALFPYVVYLVFLGPKFLGRRRSGASQPPDRWDGTPAPAGTVPDDLDRAQVSRGRSPVLRVALGVLAVVVVGAVGSALTAGASSRTSVARPEFEGLRNPASLVPMARGVTRGDPNAPLTIMVFGDYQCPGCGMFALDIQPRVDSAFVEAGRANFVFFDLPLVSLHANAFLAARAAHCAEDQERFWEYQEALFGNQAEWSPSSAPHDKFEEYAATIGLDREGFRACLDSERHVDVVEANKELARSLGIRSTPTTVISATAGAIRELRRDSFGYIAATIEEMEASSSGN